MLSELLSVLLGFLLGAFSTYYIWPKIIVNRQYSNDRLKRRHPILNTKIEEILDKFKLSDDALIKLQGILRTELEKGLSNVTHKTADIKMFPSYVRHLPLGNERGHVLALDLGGTNFRVLRITLLGGGKKPAVNSKVFVVPRSLMQSSGEKLFAHLADCVYRFLESDDKLHEHLSLGFTFSFPCVQNGIASAKLSSWTKGFSCDGVVGEDVVSLLQVALNNLGLNVTVSALINDTVGTLMACAYGQPNTSVGLIVGTGFNACYVEQLSRVGTWDGDYNEPQCVIVNTEWGAFGNSGSIDWLISQFDREIDQCSINPGEQIYEKLVSGMYMGETVRVIILHLIEQQLLFVNSIERYKIYTAPLVTPGAFPAKYVSDIEMDDGINYEKTSDVLQTLGVQSPTYEDCTIIQYVCKVVSKRAGALVAVGLSCLIERILISYDIVGDSHTDEIVVGVDGSVYRYHPKFHKNIMKPLKKLIPSNAKCRLMLSDDGSGIGAALVAHIDVLRRKSMSPTATNEKVGFFL